MITRVCWLGNSHLVAPKRAWDAHPHPEFEATFISMPGDDMKDLVVEDRVLTPPTPDGQASMANTSGGRTHVAVDDYDAFVLCGLTLRFLWLMGVYQTHRLAQHADDAHAPISRGALEETVRATLSRRSSFATLIKIRRLTNKPVVVVPEPLPTVKILDSKHSAAWDERSASDLLHIFYDTVERMYGQHGAILIRQPAGTIESAAYTKSMFAVGAIRMWKGHKFDDSNYLHMNDDYGTRIVESVLGRLPQPG